MPGVIEQGVQEGKASFDSVYDREDPRAYYDTLGRLDYEIPTHGADLFSSIVEACPMDGAGAPTVLDVCCSYGVVSALMGHDLSLDDLYEHYQQAADLSREEMLDADRQLLGHTASEVAPTLVGLDAAPNAIDYAVDAGILDRGHAENLEAAEPSADLAADLAEVDLIMVSGGVGYIGEETFGRLLANTGDGPPPWVAALSLRWIDFGPVATELARHGLVTEHVTDPSFRQRRFADDGERRAALERLAAFGIDPSGKESEGWHHADLYLARPGADVVARPATELLDVAGEVDVLGA